MENNHTLRVAIVDYQMCNLFSVMHTCIHVGLDARITSDSTFILESDGVILPGVGAFGNAIKNLKRLDLVNPIKDFIDTGKPFMGICLGMQLLMSESEEFGNFRGLDIISGMVVRLTKESDKLEHVRVPQVGWNNIYRPQNRDKNLWNGTPLENIKNGEYMYFVHSYYPVPNNDEIILSVSNYAGIEFCSSFSMKNLFAFQFHPEKSAHEGIKIYKNWASIIKHYKESRNNHGR